MQGAHLCGAGTHHCPHTGSCSVLGHRAHRTFPFLWRQTLKVPGKQKSHGAHCQQFLQGWRETQRGQNKDEKATCGQHPTVPNRKESSVAINGTQNCPNHFSCAQHSWWTLLATYVASTGSPCMLRGFKYI